MGSYCVSQWGENVTLKVFYQLVENRVANNSIHMALSIIGKKEYKTYCLHTKCCDQQNSKYLKMFVLKDLLRFKYCLQKKPLLFPYTQQDDNSKRTQDCFHP